MRWFSRQHVLPSVFTFLAFFVTAKIGQYIYFTVHTSPALIWPPVGIAIAAIFLGGYRMVIPIGIAAFLAAATNGAAPAVVLAATLGNMVQPITAVYVLSLIGFRGDLGRVRDVIGLVSISVLPTVILPTFAAFATIYTQGFDAGTLELSWSQLWIGEILSVLIFMPLVTTWSTLPVAPPRKKIFEDALAFTCLVGVIFFLFWTPFAQALGVPILYALIAVFIWMSIRMEPRAITIALLLTTVLAVAGSIISHPISTAIGKQLLSDEVFIEFIAFIFLFLVAVVEERRTASANLARHVHSLESAVETISSQDKAKNEFIAILAHELRNPLSPILSTIELLKLKRQDAESTQMIAGMEGHVQNMRRLLDDLLDIARVSQHKFDLKREPTLLNPLLTHAIEMTQSLIDARRHKLEVHIPHEKIWLSVDPVRFEQIIANLLNNAAKYTPAGGNIVIACAINDHMLTLSITDNGVGIDGERIDQIFEPFKQAVGSAVHGGLGLGLYLSKQLIEMHGGIIEVHSAGLNKGSTFTIALPILTSVPASQHETIGMPAKKLSNFKILVVDDNAAAAQGLGKLLEHRGHHVTLAYTGQQALDELHRGNANIIVLDIGLPDIDGYEVARRIKQEATPAMLIALTGYGQSDDRSKAREAGFDYHLTKPISFSEIEDLLTTHTLQGV